MKNKFNELINKNLKMIIIFGIIIVLGFGFLLMLISGNDEERDQVPVDPTQEQKTEKKERKLAQSNDHPGVSDVALNMYNARVDDMSEPAQVAQLLEASDMRSEMGGYLASLEMEDGNNVLIITYEKQLKAGEDLAFDEKATWYAEQFLCLIDEADEVKWIYEIEKDQATIEKETAEAEKKAKEEAAEKAAKEAEKNKEKDEEDSDKDKDKDKSDEEKTEEKIEIVIDKTKKVEKSLTVKQADELLKTEVKGYSKTPELVQALLNNQKGIV